MTRTWLFLGCFIAFSLACQPGWLLHGTQCYHFSHDLQTWPGAMNMCNTMDAYLVEIGSEEENNFVSSQKNMIGGYFWIGLSDEQEAGTFMWMTSQKQLNSTAYSSWATGQPTSLHNGQNCAFYGNGTQHWADAHCGYVENGGMHFVCEKHQNATQVVVVGRK